MSTLKTTNITHGSNSGTANMVLASDGGVTIPEKKLVCPGTIIQVLHMTTTADATNNDHTAWVDSGLTQAITMTAASNKVLIMANLFVYISCSGSSEIGAYAKLLRGSTALGSANGVAAHFPLNAGSGDDAQSMIPVHFYDTPGAGTHTYKIQGSPYSADNNLTMQGGGDMYSTLTLMEVAA